MFRRVQNSTFTEDLTLPTSPWKKTLSASSSISSIEQRYNSQEIKKIVESLVLSRFSEKLNTLSKRSRNRRPHLNTSESSDFSITTSGISGLVSLLHTKVIKEVEEDQSTISPDSIDALTPVETAESDEELLYSDGYTPDDSYVKATMLKIKQTQIFKAIMSPQSKFSFILERMEAEKLLLVTDIEATLFFSNPAITLSENVNAFCSGSLKLDHMHIWLEEGVFNNHYFLILMIHQSKVYVSEISEVKLNKAVWFVEKFCLADVKSNFSLDVKIFFASAKDLKKSLNCLNMCTSICQDSTSLPRESLFTPFGEFTITASDLTNNLKIRLESGVFEASVFSRPSIDINISTFLNVSCDFENIPLWNRQWCVLDQSIMKFYNYPPEGDVQAKPTAKVDLLDLEELRVLTREECVRKNCVLLKDCKTKILLSWESSHEFEYWSTHLQSIFEEIKIWTQGRKF